MKAARAKNPAASLPSVHPAIPHLGSECRGGARELYYSAGLLKEGEQAAQEGKAAAHDAAVMSAVCNFS